jgi:hypothetical protein
MRIVGTLERVGRSWRYIEQLKTSRSRRRLSMPTFIGDLVSNN